MLRKLCETSEFGTLRNSLIKNRIVLGVNFTKRREGLLRVPNLTLQKALNVVRSAEATNMQMKELDSDSSVHGIGNEKDKSTDKKPQGSVLHTAKTCTYCQKQNHFQSVCRSRTKVH